MIRKRQGNASRPILQRDKGSQTQPTYEGSGRQGTHYKKGSTTQVNARSPAFSL